VLAVRRLATATLLPSPALPAPAGHTERRVGSAGAPGAG
jgi:hypothetical protein